MIYCGEHAVSKEEIIKQIQKSVNYANTGYIDVPLGGLLLVYDSYFVHIIEVCTYYFCDHGFQSVVHITCLQRFFHKLLIV